MNKLLSKYSGYWNKFPEILRFLIIGTVNAGISYFIFVASMAILGQGYYQLSIALQWSLSSFISYLNQKFFVFNTRGNYLREYIKCCSTWLMGYILNAIIIELLIRFTSINVYISEIIAMLLIAGFTYTFMKFYAFKGKN